ncbi:alpha/beta hydrolase [Streptomyces sp. NPDC053720]|uniref:alpha/beta fold hydrolase n=1 Tax=Streptomyces sp. NPDC053720 TaxID=3154855 RepID=UPI00344000A5
MAATICAVAGAGFVGYGHMAAQAQSLSHSITGAMQGHGGHGGHGNGGLVLSGTKKIRVDGHSVSVSSYDRLGEGESESDQPKDTQTINDSGRILTGVLDRVVGDRRVVLAGHSMGGLNAPGTPPTTGTGSRAWS